MCEFDSVVFYGMVLVILLKFIYLFYGFYENTLYSVFISFALGFLALYMSVLLLCFVSLPKCLKARWTLLCRLLDSAVVGVLSLRLKSFAALGNSSASSLVIPPTTTILTGALLTITCAGVTQLMAC